MASGANPNVKAITAGMVLIRIFLGLFFLYSASAKLFVLDGLLADDADAPALVVQSVPGAAPAAQPVPLAVPQEPQFIAPELFFTELKLATAPDGPFVVHNVWPAFASFLSGMVSENADAFGWLVIVGEFAVGFLLLIGLFTRMAAFIALLINAAYLLATMHLFPPVSLLGNTAFMVMALGVLVGNAGKAVGFDALLGRKKAKPKEE